MSGGGIMPARSLRMTFSHTSACSAAFVRSSSCSDRLAVLRRSLWQVTQYRSRSARGLSLEAGSDAGFEPRPASPFTEPTDRNNMPTAQPRTRPRIMTITPAKTIAPKRSGRQIKVEAVMTALLALTTLSFAQTQRPTPPTRDPHMPGYVSARELPDGSVPAADADGNFIIGPTHSPAPEMTPNGGTLRGTVYNFETTSADSKIYPGIARDAGTF